MFEKTVFYFLLYMGIILTNLVSHQVKSSVIASALAGVFFGLIHHFCFKKQLKNEYLALLYLGSFIGMTPKLIYMNYGLISALSLMSLSIYLLTTKYCNGYGGKLGTIAFLTSIQFYFIGKL